MPDSDAGSAPPAEGAPADSPSSDEAPKKSKISVPGILAAALMIAGAACCVTAVISLPWRIGAGSTGAFAGLLGPDFKSREYYMFYVKGVSKRTWHDLTVLTCDKAAKVEITIGSQDDGICDTALAAQLPEKCSKNFLPHVQDRCHVYNFVMAINAAFSTLTFVDAGVGILIGALGAAPILKSMKKFYFPLALSLGFSSLAQLGAWMYMTDEKFQFIGRTAEFPYPGVANGFYVHAAGGGCYALAAFFYMGSWMKNAEDDGGGDEEKKDDEKKDEEKKDVEAEPI